jgi:thymidylate kinase
VRQGYLEMARAEPERWVLIDAGKPPDEVQEAIRAVVLERLKEKG